MEISKRTQELFAGKWVLLITAGLQSLNLAKFKKGLLDVPSFSTLLSEMQKCHSSPPSTAISAEKGKGEADFGVRGNQCYTLQIN